MCGICGFIERDITKPVSRDRLEKMLKQIQHRGPDSFGIWQDIENGLGFGHRRLSVVDTSPTGNQPMLSACGRYVIIFNGEIYNHNELREEIEQLDFRKRGFIRWTDKLYDPWRSTSDTETLLSCISIFGIEKALKKLVGMFAFALWDIKDKKLILARDRLGEKPLYYGFQKNTFLFASELKAMRASSAFEGEINWSAAEGFFRRNYIEAPLSIYRGIHKLTPGTYLELTQSDFKNKDLTKVKIYWSAEESALFGQQNRFQGSFEDAVGELDSLLKQSVVQQCNADVPVGAFLSGGVDSSSVVALMRSHTHSDVKTFSIGMNDAKFDESGFAAAIADYLGIQHFKQSITPKDLLDVIPRISSIWDEPFADSSQIPTFIVSHFARKSVTVALSGDGGDELFLGYPQYKMFDKLWKLRFLKKLPWTTITHYLEETNDPKLNRIIRRCKSVVGGWSQSNPNNLNRYWYDEYRGGRTPLNRHPEGVIAKDLPIFKDVPSTVALMDLCTYLPDDILVKVDRASMANSLETRAPFLDHRIVEFAHALPVNYKLGRGTDKRVLRAVLSKYIPPSLFERPKMGFSIPMDSWLRDELKDWAWDTINSLPDTDAIMDKKFVIRLWQSHQSGVSQKSKLWACLMFIEFLNANSIQN